MSNEKYLQVVIQMIFSKFIRITYIVSQIQISYYSIIDYHKFLNFGVTNIILFVEVNWLNELNFIVWETFCGD